LKLHRLRLVSPVRGCASNTPAAAVPYRRHRPSASVLNRSAHNQSRPISSAPSVGNTCCRRRRRGPPTNIYCHARLSKWWRAFS